MEVEKSTKSAAATNQMRDVLDKTEAAYVTAVPFLIWWIITKKSQRTICLIAFFSTWLAWIVLLFWLRHVTWAGMIIFSGIRIFSVFAGGCVAALGRLWIMIEWIKNFLFSGIPLVTPNAKLVGTTCITSSFYQDSVPYKLSFISHLR